MKFIRDDGFLEPNINQNFEEMSDMCAFPTTNHWRSFSDHYNSGGLEQWSARPVVRRSLSQEFQEPWSHGARDQRGDPRCCEQWEPNKVRELHFVFLNLVGFEVLVSVNAAILVVQAYICVHLCVYIYIYISHIL